MTSRTNISSPDFSAAAYLNEQLTNSDLSSASATLTDLMVSVNNQTSALNSEVTSTLARVGGVVVERVSTDVARISAGLSVLSLECAKLSDEVFADDSKGDDENLKTLKRLHSLKSELGAARQALSSYAEWTTLTNDLRSSISAIHPNSSPDVHAIALGVSSLNRVLNELSAVAGHDKRLSEYDSVVGTVTHSLVPTIQSLCKDTDVVIPTTNALSPILQLFTTIEREDIVVSEYTAPRVVSLMKLWYNRRPVSEYFPSVESKITQYHANGISSVFPEHLRSAVVGDIVEKLAESMCKGSAGNSYAERAVTKKSFQEVCTNYRATRAFVESLRTQGVADAAKLEGAEATLLKCYGVWFESFDVHFAAAADSHISTMTAACIAIIQDVSSVGGGGGVGDARSTGSPLVQSFRDARQALDKLPDVCAGMGRSCDAVMRTTMGSYDKAVSEMITKLSDKITMSTAGMTDAETSDWYAYRVNISHIISCPNSRPAACDALVRSVTNRIGVYLARIPDDEMYTVVGGDEYSVVPNGNMSLVGEYLMNSVRIMEEIAADMRVAVGDEVLEMLREVGVGSFGTLRDVLGANSSSGEDVKAVRDGKIQHLCHPQSLARGLSEDDEDDDDEEKEQETPASKFTAAVISAVCAAAAAGAVVAVAKMKGCSADGTRQVKADLEYIKNVIEAVEGSEGSVLLRHLCTLMELPVADLAGWVKRETAGEKGEAIVRRTENVVARLRGMMIFEAD
jgi:hypothetical protein